MAAPTLLGISDRESPYVGAKSLPDWVTQAVPVDSPSGSTYDVSISPDGAYAAVVSLAAEYAYVYDTSDWSRITLNPAPSDTMQGCMFSYDGQYLAIGGKSPDFVSVYDVSTWNRVQTLSTAGQVFSVRFSEDSSLLVAGHGGGDRFSVFETGTWLQITGWLNVPTWFATWSCDINVAANVVALGWYDGPPVIRVYDLTTKDLLWQEAIIATAATDSKNISINSQGTILAATFSASPYLKLYDTRTGADLGLIQSGDLPTATSQACRFTPDGSQLYVYQAFSPNVFIYDTTTWARTDRPIISSLYRSTSYDFDTSPEAGPQPTPATQDAIFHGFNF